jgi:hypothetical protein
MRTKDVAVLGLAGLVAVALVWKAFEQSPKRDVRGAIAAEQGQSARSANGERTTEARLNLLQAQVLGLQQQLATQQLPSAAAESPVAPPPVEEATPDTEADQRRLEAHMQEVVASFEAESRDANWARARTEDFQKSFTRGNLLKQAVQSVDCRSTMCRVEMLDDRSPGFFKELNDMVSIIGSNLPSMSGQRVTRPDGTAVAVYFFSKDS